MTQFDPSAQPNANQPAQPAQAGPAAPDNPQALEQTTVSDNNSSQILDLLQKVLQIVTTLKDGQDSNAKAIDSMAADIAQLAQGNTSGGVPATLS